MSRPSTSLFAPRPQDVDARDKPGHDGVWWFRPAPITPSRLPLRPPFPIVRASSERSAARLAHQSGGLGVPSSNLGAPTKILNEINVLCLCSSAQTLPVANRLQNCSPEVLV